jgi:adenosylcobinamide-phosphate synthase
MTTAIRATGIKSSRGQSEIAGQPPLETRCVPDPLSHLLLVAAAVVADALVGDPVYRYHPVRLIGDLSNCCERILFAASLQGRAGGTVHVMLVLGGSLAAWWGGRQLLDMWQPWAAWVWDAILAYSLLCSRDLLTQAYRVRASLDDLPRARDHLRRLVSRDTQHLDRPAVVRATIESLSENLTDGVLTPVWALCLFGLPGLVLVKAVSTLDSMIGYDNPRYQRFGWAAARLDDIVHWIPARLSVLVISLAAAVLGLGPWQAVRAAWRWHGVSSSPNSGWSESACAGALQVRLVGPIQYQGRLIHHDYIGDPRWPADLDGRHLGSAIRLIATSIVFATGLGMLMIVLRLLQ